MADGFVKDADQPTVTVSAPQKRDTEGFVKDDGFVRDGAAPTSPPPGQSPYENLKVGDETATWGKFVPDAVISGKQGLNSFMDSMHSLANAATGHVLDNREQRVAAQDELVKKYGLTEKTAQLAEINGVSDYQFKNRLLEAQKSARGQAMDEADKQASFGQATSNAISNPGHAADMIATKAGEMGPMMGMGGLTAKGASALRSVAADFGLQAFGDTEQALHDKGADAAHSYGGGAVAGAVTGAATAIGGKYIEPAAEWAASKIPFVGDFLRRRVAGAINMGAQGSAMAGGTKVGENVGEGKPAGEGVGDAVAQSLPSSLLTGAALPFHGRGALAAKPADQPAAAPRPATQPPGQPPAPGTLSPENLVRYGASVAHTESGGKYDTTNQLGYLGKYQLGAVALTDLGYVKPGTTQEQLADPAHWTGKDGVANPQDFLTNHTVQEQAFAQYTQNNLAALAKLGLIKPGMSQAEIAGMLKGAHLGGPGGVAAAVNGQNRADANGTTVADYMKQGADALGGQAQPENTAGIMPEHPSDVAAQIAAIREPTSEKDTALISANTALPQLPPDLLAIKLHDGATLVTSNPEKAKVAQDHNGQLTTDQLGELLGYTTRKADSDGTVVQALDRNGNVVHEEATNAQGVADAHANADRMAPAGGFVRVTTADNAIAERGAMAKGDKKVTQQRRDEAITQELQAKYGHPQPIAGPDGKPLEGKSTWNGKTFNTAEERARAVSSMIKKELQKTPAQRTAELLAAHAFNEVHGRMPTEAELKKLAGYGLTGISSEASAAANIHHAIGEVEASYTPDASGKSKAKGDISLNEDLPVLKSLYEKLTGQHYGEGINSGTSTSGVDTESGKHASAPAHAADQGSRPAEGAPATEGAAPAEAGQGQGGAAVPGSEPGHVRDGSAEGAAAEAGAKREVRGVSDTPATELSPQAQRVVGTIKLNKEKRNGQAAQPSRQVQEPAGDVPGQRGVGPDAVRPAGEPRRPAGEQGGAARDGSVRTEGTGDSRPAGDAVVRGSGNEPGAPAEPEVKPHAREDEDEAKHRRVADIVGSLFPDTDKGRRNRDIILAHYAGDTATEIAKRLGLDRSTVSKLVSDKAIQAMMPRLLEELERRGISRQDFMEDLAAHAADAPDTGGVEEGAEDSTPRVSDELGGGEDGKERQSMGTIQSIGGSQSEWADTDSASERWIKAKEAGDEAGMRAAEEELKKVPADEMGFTTSEERARDRWDQLADEHNAPLQFDDLPEEARKEFSDYVRNGHGNLNDMNKIIEDHDAGKYDTDEEEDSSYASRSKKLEALEEHYQGVADMHTWLAQHDLAHIEGSVDHWHVVSADELDGAHADFYTDERGESHVRLSQELLDSGDTEFIKQNMNHELGHGVDMADRGGVYSIQPEMRVAIDRKTNEVVPVGAVAKELHALWQDDTLGELGYPFDRERFGGLTDKAVQKEMFAQVWSMFNQSTGWRSHLQRVAPKTYEFFKDVETDVRQQPASAFSDRSRIGAAERGQAFQERKSRRNTQVPVDAGSGRASPWGNPERTARVLAAANEPDRRAATYAGRLADTADHDQLAAAKARVRMGDDPESVRKDTGWFQSSVDGEWRHEIDDSGARLKRPWDEVERSPVIGQPVEHQIGDVLDHPELLKAYPELRDVKITKRSPFLDFNQAIQGWFDPRTKQLNITPYAQDPLSTMLHELQHWVQHKEGFDQGGNTASTNLANPEVLGKLAARVKDNLTGLKDLKTPLANAHRKIQEEQLGALRAIVDRLPKLQEQQKQQEQIRQQMADLEKEKAALKQKYDDQHATAMEAWKQTQPEAKQRRDAARDRQWDNRLSAEERAAAAEEYKVAQAAYLNSITKTPGRDWQSEMAERKALDDRIKELKRDDEGIEKAKFDGVPNIDKLKHQAYELISGEREARDVQKRMDLTPAQRKSIKPYSHEGIKDEHTIRPPKESYASQSQKLSSVEEREKARESTTAKVIRNLPEPLQGPARKFADNMGHWVKTGAQAVVDGHNLAGWAKQTLGMDKPTEYMKAVSAQTAHKVDLDHQLGEIGEPASALKTHERREVGEYLRDATLGKKWGYEAPWRAWPEPADPDMAKRFEALSPEAQRVVQAIEEHGDKQRQDFQLANKQMQELGVEGKDLLTIPDMVGPYTPLRRFGDFVVHAQSPEMLDARAAGNTAKVEELKKDSAHYYYGQEESYAAAQAKANELRDAGFEGQVDAMAKDEYRKNFGVDELAALQKLAQRVETAAGKAKSPRYAKAFAQMVTNMQERILADNASRAQRMSRTGVVGVKGGEMLRGFFETAQRHNSMMAHLTHGDAVQKAMAAMHAEVGQGPDSDNRKRRQDIVNEFVKREAAVLDNPRPNRYVDGFMHLNAFWRLLASPTHYLPYLTQPMAIHIPLLSRFGYGRAWAESIKALRDTAKLGNDAPDIRKHVGKIGREAEFLQAAERANLLNTRHESEYGNPKLYADDMTSHAQAAIDKVMKIAQRIEAFNRVSSGLAAYRLAYQDAIKQGKDASAAHTAAETYAMNSIREAYFDYTLANKPRVLMAGNWAGKNAALGNVAKFATQFKQFSLQHTALVGKLVYQAFKGASKEERAVGRKMFTTMAAHYGVLAGMAGMPLGFLMLHMAHALFGKKDDTDETTMRKLIGNDRVADFVLHGAPAAMGADLTHSIGIGDLPNPYPGLGEKLGRAKTAGDAVGEVLKAAAGPLLGEQVPQMLRGMGKILDGDYHGGLTEMAPKGLRDAIKAADMARDGVTNSRGDVIVKPEDLSTLNTLLRGLGVPLLAEEKTRDRQQSVDNATQAFQHKFSVLKQEYLKPNADRADVARRWADLQAEQRDADFSQVTPISELYKAPFQKQKREMFQRDGVETTNRTRGAVNRMLEAEGAE